MTVVRFFRGLLGAADIGAIIQDFANPSEITQLGRSALTQISVLLGDAVIVSARMLLPTFTDHDVARCIDCTSYVIETGQL